MESITDENYNEFKGSARATLLISTSLCQECKRYLPTIETLAKQMDFIRFGKTILDKDRSIQLKREHPNIGGWLLPSTIFFKEQKEVGKINGVITYPELVSKINEYLLLNTTVFVQNSGGIYTPASIQRIEGVKGPYLVRLEEDSSLGEKGIFIRLPAERITWGLEAKI